MTGPPYKDEAVLPGELPEQNGFVKGGTDDRFPTLA